MGGGGGVTARMMAATMPRWVSVPQVTLCRAMEDGTVLGRWRLTGEVFAWDRKRGAPPHKVPGETFAAMAHKGLVVPAVDADAPTDARELYAALEACGETRWMEGQGTFHNAEEVEIWRLTETAKGM